MSHSAVFEFVDMSDFLLLVWREMLGNDTILGLQ